ncbi:SPRY-domain-containing protein [Artomyces pyxidatus]|uniref:SPRY-domain-containing protein n=1 Tax=Artomyces pyxidatus TaxID=48021 RepID=A0ACB8T5E6_9AGAM|nr:SPRY-domain-containing protein [Artomyces pyxidatus]
MHVGGGTVDNAGMARTNHPIPPACGIYYYEIEVLSKGQKACRCLYSFTASDTRLNKLPGWEKNSWGYHGDDGFSFSAEKAGSTYGPTFGGGDIIGAGVDFSQNRAFFTKNGTLIGMVFGNVASDVQIYPSVGLRHPNEGVRVNFGHTAFKYDIDDHVQQQRDVVWSRIQQARVDWRVLEPGRTAAASISSAFTAGSAFSSGDGNESHDIDESFVADTKVDDEGREEVGRLVLNYLVHHGYAKTANAFEEQLARSARTRTSDDLSPPLPVPPPPAPADGDSPMAAPASEPEPEPEPSALEQRLSVVHAVRRGDMDSALSSAETLFPAILERDAGLVRIKLRCRKFVELVNAAAELKRAATGTADGHGGDDADVEAMDVDEGAGASPPPAKSAAEAALRAAIAYGKALRADYKRDPRAEVQAHLEKTFSVVAYHFPMDVGGEVGRWAGQDARDVLAAEVNQAILESQGFPARPALERVYRQTAASLVQLGFLGVGAAVFADIKRELLDG